MLLLESTICSCLSTAWSVCVDMTSCRTHEPSSSWCKDLVCVWGCVGRQGHGGVIGLLGLTPSQDSLAETGLLNHPHASDQDGGPGVASTRPTSTSPLVQMGCRYCSRPRFPLNLLQERIHIQSAFCKYPERERAGSPQLCHTSCSKTRCWSASFFPLLPWILTVWLRSACLL